MYRFATITISLLSLLIAFGASPKKGAKKKTVDYAAAAIAAREGAINSFMAYDFDAATDHLEDWEEALTKLKSELPEEMGELDRQILMARNMLDRVEKIEIIDTLHVEAETFFSHYRLSTDAGTLNDATILPDEYAALNPKVVYLPESGKEMLWSMQGEDGRRVLYVANVLDDGTVDTPTVYADLMEDGDIDYPFMMQDGMTIYFGATGEASLGGYDIFMTRRDEEGTMLQPQNIGMPYNSPYNDYMLAIDETSGLGWWASDRGSQPGMVTIYVFAPSKMRVNHEPDSEDIKEIALLKKLDLSGNLDDRLPTIDENAEVEQEFYLPMGNGKVYTRLSQFRNSQARQSMKNLLKRQFDLEVAEAQLANLRQRYANGDKSVASDILKLEKTVRDAPAAIKRSTNQVITMETR